MAAIHGFNSFGHLEYICGNIIAKALTITSNITEDMAVLCHGSSNTTTEDNQHTANEWLQLMASNFFEHLEYTCVNIVSEFCVMKSNITEDMAVLLGGSLCHSLKE